MNEIIERYRRSIAMYPIPAEAPPPPARGTYRPNKAVLRPESFSLAWAVQRDLFNRYRNRSKPQ
jgi:hypothetical protein